jgi:Rod binding domain-containing protein
MSALPPIPTAGLPIINPATEPASVRNGPPAAKRAYQTALSFEQVLVDQLAQALSSTVGGSGSDGESGGGSGDGSSSDASSGGGLMGGDATTSAYAGMLPGTLSSAIMSGGGTGIALQLAKALDPALAAPATAQRGSTA